MDTAPDAPGENIRARVTEAYDGGDVVLNEEKHIVLSPKEYPQMKHAIGKRLIDPRADGAGKSRAGTKSTRDSPDVSCACGGKGCAGFRRH